jgi:hypothetical protein
MFKIALYCNVYFFNLGEYLLLETNMAIGWVEVASAISYTAFGTVFVYSSECNSVLERGKVSLYYYCCYSCYFHYYCYRYFEFPPPPNLPNRSSRTMALGFIQSLTEINTRNVCGGAKHGRRIRPITSPPSVTRLSRQCGIPDV